jgi:hypothetical protein
MKTVLCFAFLLSTANPSRTGGSQGNELIVISAEASVLSAVVEDSSGQPLAGVAVVQFPCPKGKFRGETEPKEIAKMVTGDEGRFHFNWHRFRTACLQFSLPGFDLLQVKVRHSREGGELHPVLHVGT